MVTITITATDPDSEAATSDVTIRLNAPPTEITGTNTATVAENGQAAADLVTDLNVQDHNAPTHAFGQYEWEVSDARFTVTAGTTDSSTATLAVKAGQTFEHNGGATPVTVAVKVTATEKASGESVDFTVTVTVTNDTTDDPTAPATPDPVPGLKDDETGGDGTETDAADDDANGTDGDQDGGVPPPPPPMMMIGGRSAG